MKKKRAVVPLWTTIKDNEAAVKAFFNRYDPTKNDCEGNEDNMWALIRELLIFAERPNAFSLAQFCAEQRINERYFRKLCNKYQYLDEARAIAKTNIAARLLLKAFDDPRFAYCVSNLLPAYDLEYLDTLRVKASLKKQAELEQIQQPIRIVMERYTDQEESSYAKATEDKKESNGRKGDTS